jgi:hypothetical protein
MDGVCDFAGDSCDTGGLLCDEDSNTCVECLDDGDCSVIDFCLDTVCMPRCEIAVSHKKIRYDKLTKPRKVKLKITGNEYFDIFGEIDLGPLTLLKTSFKTKKNKLKIKAIVPEGLSPGIIPISIGDCLGEITITDPQFDGFELHEFSGQVSMSSDDGMEQENTGDIVNCSHYNLLTMNDLDLGRDDDFYGDRTCSRSCACNEAMIAAMRFTDVTIPPWYNRMPVKIKSAYIEFTARRADESNWDAALTLKITAQSSNDPPTLNTTIDNISSRLDTAAFVTWNMSEGEWITDQTYTSPDLTSIIQELVSLPGWQEGNAMLFKIDAGDEEGGRVVHSFESNVNYAPRLVIEYGLAVD